MTAPRFELVPRLPGHHLRGASMPDGPRLWVSAAFGGDVSLSVDGAGMHHAIVISPAVARAIAAELVACADVYGGAA